MHYYFAVRDMFKAMISIRSISIRTALFAFVLTPIFLNGQIKIKTPKDSLNPQPKLLKNHFFQWPDEYLFIQCGLQDKKGGLWFGSAGDGIYYYDGKSFFNFTQNDGLCHNDILCCMEDKNGIIWFGTRNGLIRYKPSGKKPEKNNFKSILISQHLVKSGTRGKIPYTYVPADNFVWSVFQDKSGLIWFGTNKGVYIYDPLSSNSDDSLSFIDFLDNDKLVNKNGLKLKEISCILEDKKGALWFVSNWNPGEGICRFDGKSLTSFKPDSLNSFRSIVERKNGDLLFLNAFHGIYSYDGKSFSKLSEKISVENGAFTTMKEDRSGKLWVGTNSDNIKNGGDGGVLYYDGKLARLFSTKDGLSHNCVFSIVEDKDGNIWFGTRNTGLCRYNGKIFTDYTE